MWVLSAIYLAAGCSTVKELIESLAGIRDNRTDMHMYIWREKVHGPWEWQLALNNKSIKEEERKEIIQTYYKFMILRDPMERILSAYKSKVRMLFYCSTWTSKLR